MIDVDNKQPRNNSPINFKEGVRVLMLIDRGSQTSNKGSKGWINKIITTNPFDYDKAVNQLLSLQHYLHAPNTDIRLYACANRRNMKKAIITFKHKQLDLITDNEDGFYSRINDSFCSCLMQPENKEQRLFLLDIDTKDLTVANHLVKEHHILVHYRYPTPNGWHYLTNAFNTALGANYENIDIKKDGLMLLHWIDN